MSKTIALIGLSGCGKTTYGKKLAQKLNRNFYDIDDLVEANEKMTISQIFSEKGESYFRKVEWEMFIKCCSDTNAVIATGGGLVPQAYKSKMEKPKHIFFLFIDTPVETIVNRLSSPEILNVRPLLSKNDDLYKQIQRLHAERLQAYLAWSDGRLSTN